MSKIYVFADWAGVPPEQAIGVIHIDQRGRGGEIFSFEFEDVFLEEHYGTGLVLDPDIQLVEGRQYPSNNKTFGMVADSSPDRWGRLLMDRRLMLDQREGRVSAAYTLRESDYLLGVHDAYRSGALRFKRSLDGPFLDDRDHQGAPPLTKIGNLIAASEQMERDEDIPDTAVRELIAPGGSLGGARPKALVSALDGEVMIAKFPSVNDRHDVGAWEFVVATLARGCGIDIAECSAQRFASPHHTFLTRRFDRTPEGHRVHFASAMTMTGKQDGDSASYLDIAEAIQLYCYDTDADLLALWRRIVFNILVSNCDDHLRNHGFLLHPGLGWKLSPAYDLNPDTRRGALHTNINETENELSLELALSVIKFFRIDPDEAIQIIQQFASIIRQWRNVAAHKDLRLTPSEINKMASAFKLADIAI